MGQGLEWAAANTRYVHYTAVQLCPHNDGELREELVSYAYSRADDVSNTFDDSKGSFDTHMMRGLWFYAMKRRDAINLERRSQCGKARHSLVVHRGKLYSANGELHEVTMPDASIERQFEIMVALDEWKVVEQKLLDVDPIYVATIRLRVLGGVTNSQVARMLGISRYVASQTLANALEEARTVLGCLSPEAALVLLLREVREELLDRR